MASTVEGNGGYQPPSADQIIEGDPYAGAVSRYFAALLPLIETLTPDVARSTQRLIRQRRGNRPNESHQHPQVNGTLKILQPT